MTPDELDQATIDLIFALRDSLTDAGPSRLDFWTGRASTALETAATAATMPEAVTLACRKLQIPILDKGASAAVVKVAAAVTDFEAWCDHITRNGIYILALARVLNDEKKTTNRKPETTPAAAVDAALPF